MHRSALAGPAPLSCALYVAALACLAAQSAQATVTISEAATSNISCSGGVCMPTAKNAVLNAGDLETLLASGNATVTTTGSGVQANNIVAGAKLNWATSNSLALVANTTITVNAAISVTGSGGLALSDDGGVASLSFGQGGNVEFANLSSALAINGRSYTLVDTVSGLAGAIGSDPSGAFAFARNYNAKKDGTYSSPPVSTSFTGTFEGLGNTISNLSINDAGDDEVGLFAYVDGGYLHDIGLSRARVSSQASSVIIGALVGYIVGAETEGTSYSGAITGAWVSGTVSAASSTYAQIGGLAGSACNYGQGYQPDAVFGSHSAVNVSGGQSNFAGGLVGYSCGDGVVEDSYATGTITASTCSYVGGLVGASTGFVDGSFATGAATTGGSGDCEPAPSAGGLVGYNFGVGSSPGTITNSYSTGAAAGGSGTNVGGMVGLSYDGTIADSYSTGAPSAGSGSYVGGFVGNDESAALSDTYWDTTTSGITNLSQGAGNISNAAGIAGETTAELQAGLPAGFAKSVWRENAKINGGLPYLKADPPPK